MTDTGATQARWSTWLRWLGTVASLVLLIVLLRRQDWTEIARSAGHVSPGTLVLALALLMAAQAFNTFRWWFLLRGQDIPMTYMAAARLVFAGLFASNFLPSTIGGDVVRLAGVVAAATNRMAGAASVVVDRAVSVFGMLFLLPLSVTTFLPAVTAGSWPWAGTAAAAPAGGFVRRSFRRLYDALRLWAARPSSLAKALGASWAGVACYLLAVWIVARGLGMTVSLGQVAGVTGLTYLLTLIPLSINGYGLREAAMVTLYVQIGSVAEQAAALALVSRLLMMAATIPGAAVLPGAFNAKRPSA